MAEISTDPSQLLVAEYADGSITFIHPVEAERLRGTPGCKIRKPRKSDYDKTSDDSRRFVEAMQADPRKD